MQLASWWFWNTAPRDASELAGTRPIWPSLAWPTGSRAWTLRGSDETSTMFWLPGRGRALAARRERDPGPLPLPARPTVWSRGHTFVYSASGRVCALCPHPEHSAHGRCPGTAGSGARGAAQQIGLGGSTEHTIVGGLSALRRRVVRHCLLSTYPGATTPGRRLALRDGALGFPAWFQARGAVGFCSWGSFACLVWSLSHQGPSLPVCPAPLLAAESSRAAIEPVLNLPCSTFLFDLFVRRRCEEHPVSKAWESGQQYPCERARHVSYERFCIWYQAGLL